MSNTGNAAHSKLFSCFDGLSADVILQAYVDQRFIETYVPDAMLPMMNTFQVQLSPPQVIHNSSYYEFSSSMSLRKVIAVNSKTVFDDELFQENNLDHHISGSQVQLAQCKQTPAILLQIMMRRTFAGT